MYTASKFSDENRVKLVVRWLDLGTRRSLNNRGRRKFSLKNNNLKKSINFAIKSIMSTI